MIPSPTNHIQQQRSNSNLPAKNPIKSVNVNSSISPNLAPFTTNAKNHIKSPLANEINKITTSLQQQSNTSLPVSSSLTTAQKNKKILPQPAPNIQSSLPSNSLPVQSSPLFISPSIHLNNTINNKKTIIPKTPVALNTQTSKSQTHSNSTTPINTKSHSFSSNSNSNISNSSPSPSSAVPLSPVKRTQSVMNRSNSSSLSNSSGSNKTTKSTTNSSKNNY